MIKKKCMLSVWPSEGGMGAAGCESAFVVTADFCRAQSMHTAWWKTWEQISWGIKGVTRASRPLCLEGAAGHRQAALPNQPQWQDSPTDVALLGKLVFRGSLPGSRMHILGMVPVLNISEVLSLPSTVLSSYRVLASASPCPVGLFGICLRCLYNFDLYVSSPVSLTSNTLMTQCR